MGAEKTIISHCLRSEDGFLYASERLDGLAFQSERHAEIWRAITALYFEEAHVTPEAVALRMGEQPDALSHAVTVPFAVLKSAVETVRGMYRRNRLAWLGQELATRALDLDEDDGLVLMDMAERLEAPELSVDTMSLPPSLPEFLARSVEYDWLVEKVFERGDRLILTGTEGQGKSTLLRQWALSMASGQCPMTMARTEPVRVLYLDCENSAAQIQRGFAKILQRLPGKTAPATLFVESCPQGLDLLRAGDQRWLTSKVAATRPDILVGGPLYKLFVASPDDEESARHLAAYFDRLRKRFSLALLLEAHSPHGVANDRAGLRPFGSSLWLRWPEFGFGLVESKNQGQATFRPWRGVRDERSFPDRWDKGDPRKFEPMWVPYFAV